MLRPATEVTTITPTPPRACLIFIIASRALSLLLPAKPSFTPPLIPPQMRIARTRAPKTTARICQIHGNSDSAEKSKYPLPFWSLMTVSRSPVPGVGSAAEAVVLNMANTVSVAASDVTGRRMVVRMMALLGLRVRWSFMVKFTARRSRWAACS